MKKNPFILISLLVIFGIILAACTPADTGNQPGGGEVVGSDTTSPPQPPSTQAVSPGDTVAPPAPPTEDLAPKPPEELPPIPPVSFGPGSDWFRPTPPGEIQLASGKVQLFEFSIVT